MRKYLGTFGGSSAADNGDGNLLYCILNLRVLISQAGSPDEAALVVAAKVFGFFFHARTPRGVKVRAAFSKQTSMMCLQSTFHFLSQQLHMIANVHCCCHGALDEHRTSEPIAHRCGRQGRCRR